MPATSTNMFGSIFGSNNAPLPVPGGYGGGQKPSGMTGATNALPGITPYNTPPGVAPTNPGFNSPTYSTQDLAGLNSGISGKGTGVNAKNLEEELTRAYGKGTGSLLAQMFKNGLFNPSVASAFLNAQQPGIARGQNDILSAFGSAGARYSSAASLGLGDYMSQVQLSQQQTLAGLYEHSQDQELSLLSGAMPTLHQEEADKGGGILDDILGGLEIAGGVALMATGVGIAPGAMLAAGGVGTIASGNKPSSSAPGGGSQPSLMSSLQQLLKQNNSSPNATGVPGVTPGGVMSGIPGSSGTLDELNTLTMENAQVSDAGDMFGTSQPGVPNEETNMNDQLRQLLAMLGGGNA